LPTADEFAREFPLMSVVKLRIEIERILREILFDNDLASKAPAGIGNMLSELHQRGLAPASTERFLESLRVMNSAVHGVDVDPMSAEQAVEIGTAFLAELRGMR
ncbi:MAG TPA: DUF1016 domain-containing protein, partial [Pararobbsia sp.]|nr:DUF1016 domain-containing protein [Pararobbsia sp.]